MNPDLFLFRQLNGLAGTLPTVDAIMQFVVNDYVVPTALAAMLVYLWFGGRQRLREAVIRAVIAVMLANAIVKLSNVLWYRPRPFTYNDVNLLFYFPSDSSFPANSIAAAFAIAWTVWLVNRSVGRWAVLLASAMAVARVYVGVHYPLDVLGGAIVGILAGAALQLAAPSLQPVTGPLARLLARLGLA